jgi:hypothetical protein
MNANECLKEEIRNIGFVINKDFEFIRRKEGCEIDQNSRSSKSHIKMTGLKIKLCSVYGKISPDDAVNHIENILDKLALISSGICDVNDLDFALNEISDIGTYIIGMTDTSLNNHISN